MYKYINDLLYLDYDFDFEDKSCPWRNTSLKLYNRDIFIWFIPNDLNEVYNERFNLIKDYRIPDSSL